MAFRSDVVLRSDDAVFVRAPVGAIVEALTRLSVSCGWWPRAIATGAYGWVDLRAPAGRGRVRVRADIGPVAADGFGWEITEGDVVGRAHWWLDERDDGVIVRHLLDARPGPRRSVRPAGTHRRYRWAIRGGMNALKDHLEPARASRGPARPPLP